MGEPVVAGGDPAEVLEAAEHAFDGVAVTVEIGREAALPATIGLRRDVGSSALALDLAAYRVAVIALVAVQDFGGGEVVEQGIGGNAVGDLAEVNRKAIGQQKQSVSAWILVVRRPRERPIAWFRSPLFRPRRSGEL